MARRPRLTDYDRGMIRFLVGKIHVGTSDLDVLRIIVKKIQGGLRALQAAGTRGYRRDLYRYALRCHRANGECYHRIMTGRI